MSSVPTHNVLFLNFLASWLKLAASLFCSLKPDISPLLHMISNDSINQILRLSFFRTKHSIFTLISYFFTPGFITIIVGKGQNYCSQCTYSQSHEFVKLLLQYNIKKVGPWKNIVSREYISVGTESFIEQLAAPKKYQYAYISQ